MTAFQRHRRGFYPDGTAKARLCKGRYLRFAAIGAGRSISSGSLKPLSVCFRETDLQISQMQRWARSTPYEGPLRAGSGHLTKR